MHINDTYILYEILDGGNLPEYFIGRILVKTLKGKLFKDVKITRGNEYSATSWSYNFTELLFREEFTTILNTRDGLSQREIDLLKIKI